MVPDNPPVVFLLGVPRSGTTLLSWLLNQHQSLYCPPEPWLLLGLDAIGQVPADHIADPPLLFGAITEFLGEKRLQALKQAALSIYQQALQETGKSVFVDKTPRYYHALELVKEFLPDGKVILLLRNPLDVAASFKSSWQVDLPKIISGQEDTPFLSDYVLGFNYLLDFEKNHSVLRVHYENLVAKPEAEMARILDYLALPPQTFGGDLGGQKIFYFKSSFGDRKIFYTHGVHTRSINTYKAVFSKKEVAILLHGLGKDNFSKLGYTEQYADACAEFEIAPSNEMSTQLFKVAEEYAWQRRRLCSTPWSRGELEQKVAHLNQQLENFQIKNKELDKQLASAQAHNKTLNEQLALLQAQKEEINQQLYGLQHMNLRGRLQADLNYAKKSLKHALKRGLWRMAQGPAMPPLPKITIVTPVFNGAEFIEATLRSVLVQSYPALEFIVVDGGSTDATLAVIDRVQNDCTLPNKITQIISEPDQGMYDALAKGFALATGEILAYLNADDLLEGGALAAVGEYFSRHPKVSVIYHEDAVLVRGWKYPNVRQPKGIATADLLNKHILFQDGVFFRRGAYQAIGGLRCDLKLAGDYDLWLRLSARFKFVRRPGHVSCFRIRRGQLSENMEDYYREVERSREDFLARASYLQKKCWQIQSQYRFLRKYLSVFAGNNRLFFPIDFSNMPPPSVTLTGPEYGQALSPVDEKPVERLLFSAPDTRFGDNTIHHIYLDTRHAIAVTYPPVEASELDRLYRQNYSAPPVTIKNPAAASPYRQFSGKRLWEKALLHLPVEKIARFLPNGWSDNTLAELTSVLRAARVDINRSLRVLDAGCFEGHLLDEIAALNTWRAYGLEPNARAVAIARGKGHQVWQGHAEDAVEIIPETHQFDVIFMGQSIEHMDRPKQVLRRLRCLLAPGGVVVVSTPNLDSRQIDWFGPTWAHWHPPYHRYIFSRQGLVALARQVGLQPVCFKTFSHCYWTAMSLMQNFLGLGGSVSHAVNFDRPLCLQAQRIYFWQQLLWNRIGRGDYCFFAMKDGEGN